MSCASNRPSACSTRSRGCMETPSKRLDETVPSRRQTIAGTGPSRPLARLRPMPRTPTGAAVLQPEVTQAITEAVMWELAEQGYGRLSMEAVAKRAGVGKSALYRRWASKDHMIASVVTEFSVTRAADVNTGSLRGDLR